MFLSLTVAACEDSRPRPSPSTARSGWQSHEKVVGMSRASERQGPSLAAGRGERPQRFTQHLPRTGRCRLLPAMILERQRALSKETGRGWSKATRDVTQREGLRTAEVKGDEEKERSSSLERLRLLELLVGRVC